MKHLKQHPIFEAKNQTVYKYFLNLSSANSRISIEDWIDGGAGSKDESLRKDAERNWSLFPVLDKVKIPKEARVLSNTELANLDEFSYEWVIKNYPNIDYFDFLYIYKQLNRGNINMSQIDECGRLVKRFNSLFNNFRYELTIDKKVEFVSLLNDEGWVVGKGGILKVFDNEEDLKEEMDSVSDMLLYYLD